MISGYLITSIILREKDKDNFSLVHFYERRARRILPALFFIMAFSLIPAWLWLFPRDLKDFSQSIVAVTAFASNFLFWHESGYWDTSSQLKPHLHTWSLAIEEQFYLLFPLFLMSLWKFRRRWLFFALSIVALLSLFLSEIASRRYPMANFYLLPTRAWELAIGALLAFYLSYSNKNKLIPHILHESLAFLGLTMIIFAIATFNEKTPIPSLFALLPTAGTALVILFGSTKTKTGKFLS